MSVVDQENTIGKIIWKQVDTVVILKKNMRMQEMSATDVKYRAALENMRYAACTPDDIAFLRTRVIGPKPGQPRFDYPNFRSVPIITAWNSQKDKLNEIGSRRFADDTGQTLTDFFSVDSLAPSSSDRVERKNRNKAKLPSYRFLSESERRELSNSHPCTSEHIAGKLSLCVGMPVMIKNNDATELCITKGQEGTVAGWQESYDEHGRRILDTLFVKLVKPPRVINIPGLAENIVALSRASKRIWCSFPNDMVVAILREQVLVLPNFAMTDYASQGKTRVFNVVDLQHCKSHFSYYTCLSRSSTAAGTAIVQAFATTAITKGITGYLRQEFRELELLNEITEGKYSCTG
jgi:hypothetical protein